MTFTHSPGTTPAKPFIAMAPPVMPAMREWDFEAGIPFHQQKKPQLMEAIMAASSARSAMCVCPVKLTMPNMVCATAVEM